MSELDDFLRWTAKVNNGDISVRDEFDRKVDRTQGPGYATLAGWIAIYRKNK